MTQLSRGSTIMVAGSGPIVIGQAAEFDYSGSQACKALRELGYRVILVNSNPATIQTDREIADVVYLEPLHPEVLEELLRRERPEGFLGTLGGQTGLNLTANLAERGVFDELNVEVLGTTVDTIHLAEDRQKFNDFMKELGEPVSESYAANSMEEVLDAVQDTGYPVIVRPAYTLGGTGGGVAENEEELREIARRGLDRSQVNQVLVDESLLGWMEYEYEVMRDRADNCIIVCNMENVDPMGLHTGESIVTAPAQVLTDREHQTLRSTAIKIIRALDIQGGCNIQFAVDPRSRDYSIVEVNPRVSRSSALASKVTGYPIAKISAEIAAGRTLDDIPNDIIQSVPASFEPALDYVVVKMPRWPFDRFQEVDAELTTQMKSTGEAMAIGRSFEEALQKAIRSLDIGRDGLCADGREEEHDPDQIREELENPTDRRIFAIFDAFRIGMDLEEVYEYSSVPRFYLHRIRNIAEMADELASYDADSLSEDLEIKARKYGFSREQLDHLLGSPEGPEHYEPSETPVFRMVDTCAGEFRAETPYYYSTWEAPGSGADLISNRREHATDEKSVMVLGGGPIRIGQGIEFDYCCVHASIALGEEGYQSIMVNNNPETVSTDYDTSDRLYFEPLTVESVLHIIRREQPEGVIVQFGGQTPLDLAGPLQKEGVQILGTPPESIDRAENRQSFSRAMNRLGIPQAPFSSVHSKDEALDTAREIGYPVIVRPSYVLGGKTMDIVYDNEELEAFLSRGIKVNEENPVLLDRFLEGSTEIDVDAVSDGEDIYIGGIMEHIEEAGIHSGDSSCVIPPRSLSDDILERIRTCTRRIARELNVVGLLNLQFAIRQDTVYLLEANPRASRTIPFVSKAAGVPLTKLATRVMLGRTLSELGYTGEARVDRQAVKAPVFPFEKLPGVDSVLGPEMKSTGEVMGIDHGFGRAFYKAQLAAGNPLPTEGTLLLSISDEKKSDILPVARGFSEMGFELLATGGTAAFLTARDVPAESVRKVSEGSPNLVDRIMEGDVDLVINIPTGGKGPRSDGYRIRRAAVDLDVPYLTTATAAEAALEAVERIRARARQDYRDRNVSFIPAIK